MRAQHEPQCRSGGERHRVRVVGLNVLKSLAALGVEVAFFPRPVGGPEPSLDLAEVALIMRCVRRQRTFDMTAPCLRISGEDDMTLFAGRGPAVGWRSSTLRDSRMSSSGTSAGSM